MTTIDEAEPRAEAGDDAGSDGSRPVIDRAPGVAAAVFALTVAIAFVAYLRAGKEEWFYLDEWDFLAGRDGGSLADVFRSHNEHWTSLPILAYRVLFNVFGLRSYTPYLALAIATHLAVAVVLRTLMRRAGVGPWIATAAASLFVLFGSGDGNILRGFQVTFSGALLFGLIHVLLIDHDGGVDWHDWVGLLAGVAALMCSGVGVAMVASAGVAALLRRRWHVAALHAIPLALIYATWWWFEGRTERAVRWQWHDIATFAGATFDETASALTQLRFGGVVALVLFAACGLVLAWRHPSRPDVRRRMAAPLGLVASAVLFVFSTATGRLLLGSELTRASRYIHIVGALLLPALAVAATAITRRWRALGPVMVVLFLLPIPGNVAIAFDNELPHHVPKGDRDLMLAFGAVPTAAAVPALDCSRSGERPELTVGWLLDGIASGGVPTPDEIPPGAAAEATLRLTIQQTPETAPVLGCQSVTKSFVRHMERGQSFGIRGGPIRLVNVVDGTPLGGVARFNHGSAKPYGPSPDRSTSGSATTTGLDRRPPAVDARRADSRGALRW